MRRENGFDIERGSHLQSNTWDLSGLWHIPVKDGINIDMRNLFESVSFVRGWFITLVR